MLARGHDYHLERLGLQARPTVGLRWIFHSSAKTVATQCLSIRRIRARRFARGGLSSFTTRLARFSTQPIAWSKRRSASAETARPLARSPQGQCGAAPARAAPDLRLGTALRP